MLLLSGGRRSGKSTLLLELYRDAVGQGMTIGGVISLKAPAGIDVLYLPESSDRPSTPLARFLSTPDAIDSDARDDTILLGPYHFSRPTIDTVNTHLITISDGTWRGIRLDAIIVDEIGPLELKRGDGLLPGFLRVIDTPVPLIVVVRPELISEAIAMVVRAGRDIVAVIPDPVPRDEAMRRIFEYITM